MTYTYETAPDAFSVNRTTITAALKATAYVATVIAAITVLNVINHGILTLSLSATASIVSLIVTVAALRWLMVRNAVDNTNLERDWGDNMTTLAVTASSVMLFISLSALALQIADLNIADIAMVEKTWFVQVVSTKATTVLHAVQ